MVTTPHTKSQNKNHPIVPHTHTPTHPHHKAKDTTHINRPSFTQHSNMHTQERKREREKRRQNRKRERDRKRRTREKKRRAAKRRKGQKKERKRGRGDRTERGRGEQGEERGRGDDDDNLEQMFPVSIYTTNYMHELTQLRPKLR